VVGLISIALWATGKELVLLGRAYSRVHHKGGTNGFVEVKWGCWWKRYSLAGFCCGVAIASEYTAALAATAILVLALLVGYRQFLVAALAASVPLSLVFIYNTLCFGGPFAFGYHHLALTEFQGMNQGLFGITFPPRGSAIYLLLLSPERGLLLWTPFFLLGYPGGKALLKRIPPLAWVCIAVITLQVLCIAGYFMPSGGAALGPRHLAPMLPFAAILAALGLEKFPKAGYFLGYYSIVITALGTVINAMPSDNMPHPWLTFYVPRLLRGEFANLLGDYLALPRLVSALLIVMFPVLYYFWQCSQGAMKQTQRDSRF